MALHTHSEPPDTFIDIFTRLAGIAHSAADPSAFEPILESILEEHRPQSIAAAGLPPDYLDAVQRVAHKNSVELLVSPFPGRALPDAVDGAGVGITMASFAVAETGSLVELTAQDADRLASSLPRVHICLVRRDTIVATLVDAAPRLRQAFEHNVAMTATFISGPSRTGDIEMKLTLGVHGPEIMHVVIID